MMRLLLNGLKQAPQLDRLHIAIQSDGPGHSNVDPLSMEGKFNPKSLSVVTSSLLGVIPLTWERLIEFGAGMIAVNELLHIIQIATNLRSLRILSITRANNRPEFPMPTYPIIHDSLTHLDTEKSAYVGILQHLSLPALQNLEHGFYWNSHDNLNSRLRSDGDWFDKLPSVTHLHIKIPTVKSESREDRLRITDHLLSPLDAQRQPLAFPLLREFGITATILSSKSWSYICNMFGPASTGDESDDSTTKGLFSTPSQEQSTRHLERISVCLTEQGGNFKPDVMISKRDYGRLVEIQRSGVRIELTIGGDYPYGRSKSLEWLMVRPHGWEEIEDYEDWYCYDWFLDSSSEFR